MKIGIIGIDVFSQGKANIIDKRVDTLADMFKSAKKVYIQADVVKDQEKLKEADGILCPENTKLDLILGDLEFVELRIERSADEQEKLLLKRFKELLDKESFLTGIVLSEDEKKLVSGYPLLTIKPVYLVKDAEIEQKDTLLFSAYTYFGYFSFFTAGDKDSHAWSIRKGANAWEAAGCIHSDIQHGFIRAEVVSYQDLINDGSLSRARSNNHLRLENKEYVVVDGDYMVFRFNK